MSACYKCGGSLQSAAMNPAHLWCTVCAEELNMAGGPLAKKESVPVEVARGEVSMPAESAPILPPVSTVGEQRTRAFRVTVGGVSFTATGRTELSVGKSKVVIELLPP